MSIKPKQFILPLLAAVFAGALLCLLLPRPDGTPRPVADAPPGPVPEASHASEVAPATTRHAPAKPLPPSARSATGATSQTREQLEAEARAALKALRQTSGERVLSEPVRILTGADEPLKDYHTAINAMRRLTRKLSADDVAALREFLAQPMLEGEALSMRAIEYNAVRNDILDILLQQNTLPEDLHFDLVAMFRDESQDDVWRTYSVQYLAPYWETRWPDSSSPDPRAPSSELQASSPDLLSQSVIRDTLREALAERGNSVAGTALIGMNDLRKSRNVFNEDEIREAAIEIALDTNASEASRVTALRICAQLGADEVLDETRFLAQAGSTGMLRLAAMATLGDLGDRRDAQLLAALAEENERFKPITAKAIANIEKRY